jgi:hypothetical protein
MLVIPATVNTKQITSLGGYVYREAPQGAMRFVGFLFLMLVIPAAAKSKQITSLEGYVYREAPRGAMRFVGFFYFGGSSFKLHPQCFRTNQTTHTSISKMKK